MCASIPLHRRNQRNGRKWLTLVVDRAQNHRQPQADVQIHWYNPLPISPHIEPCRTLLITLRGIERHLGRYSTEFEPRDVPPRQAQVSVLSGHCDVCVECKWLIFCG